MFGKIAIILCALLPQIFTKQCLTPNNETAQCIPLFSCPILIGALATQHQISLKFVSESNCGGTIQNPKACCGTLANYTTIKTSPRNQSSDSKIKLLPTNQYCGYQHADDYFREDQDPSTRLTEFPWLGLIKIRNLDTNESEYLCSATLINRRYVLTAAQCVRNPDTYGVKYIADAVRLGEYNIKNTTDCVNEEQFEEECSEPLQEIGAEKIISHPQYNLGKKIHDIALIRLAKNVDYSDYIRPICLPLPGRPTAQAGDTLFSTGWGKKTIDGKPAEIKKKVLSEMISQETCIEEWKNLSSRVVNITDGHLCAITFVNNTVDECLGDSGGPLMSSYSSQWQQEGIVSFGKTCGLPFPAFYTNVKTYIDWILEVIEP